MAFYNEMRTMANGLFTQFGNSFVLKKPDGEAKYNPKTKKTEQSFIEYSGKCVMKAYSAETIGLLSNIINAGDVEFVCTMDNIEIIPTENKDKLVYANNTYNIINVTTINPSGDSVVIYKIQCRRVSK